MKATITNTHREFAATHIVCCPWPNQHTDIISLVESKAQLVADSEAAAIDITKSEWLTFANEREELIASLRQRRDELCTEVEQLEDVIVATRQCSIPLAQVNQSCLHPSRNTRLGVHKTATNIWFLNLVMAPAPPWNVFGALRLTTKTLNSHN